MDFSNCLNLNLLGKFIEKIPLKIPVTKNQMLDFSDIHGSTEKNQGETQKVLSFTQKKAGWNAKNNVDGLPKIQLAW